MLKELYLNLWPLNFYYDFYKLFKTKMLRSSYLVKNKSKVKRFSKIYYTKKSKTRSPIALALIYFFVFVFIAVFSYLFSMGLNSYLKRPHCTKIEFQPEEFEESETSRNDMAPRSKKHDSQEKGDSANDFESKNFNNVFNGVEVDLKTIKSSDAFDKFLKQAKAESKNAVVVCLKGPDGKLAFDSSLQLAQEWKTIFAESSINFEEVAEKIKESGLIPIARMSAFFDQTAPSVERNNTYIIKKTEADKGTVNVFGAETGHKKGKWLDATKQKVRAYVVGLAVEMVNLGFKYVLIDNAWFPSFKTTYERENFENGFCDEKARLNAMSKFIDELQAGGVKAILSYPSKVLFDSDLAISLFGSSNLLKKIKMHAPIFLEESEIKKSEQVLIEIDNRLVFSPELYSNSKNINKLLEKLRSYEIGSKFIIRNN